MTSDGQPSSSPATHFDANVDKTSREAVIDIAKSAATPIPVTNHRRVLCEDPEQLGALIPKPQIPIVIEDINTIVRREGRQENHDTPPA
jgi:hypothetical protein